jgi:hypothetical protein
VDGDGEVVKPPRAGKTRFAGRVEDASRFPQQSPRVLGGEKLEEPFRADTGPAAEEALEMERAQARRPRYVLQARLFPEMRFEITDCPFYALVIPGPHDRAPAPDLLPTSTMTPVARTLNPILAELPAGAKFERYGRARD